MSAAMSSRDCGRGPSEKARRSVPISTVLADARSLRNTAATRPKAADATAHKKDRQKLEIPVHEG